MTLERCCEELHLIIFLRVGRDKECMNAENVHDCDWGRGEYDAKWDVSHVKESTSRL